jgi:hypothetical protein
VLNQLIGVATPSIFITESPTATETIKKNLHKFTSNTPQIHITNTHHKYTSQIHITNTHHKYTSQIHTTNTHHKYTPQIHITNTHHKNE